MSKGLRCPKCWCRRYRVTNTYHVEQKYGDHFIEINRRRLECEHCGSSWFSVEHNEIKSVVPIDGITKEPITDIPDTTQPKKPDLDSPNPFL